MSRATLVIGAGGRLGRAIITGLQQDDEHIVYAADLDRPALLTDLPLPEERCIQVDCTSRLELLAAIDRIEKLSGRLDAVVNTAYPRGPRYGAKFEDVTYEDFCRNVSLHLGGYFLVAQLSAEYFRQRGGGTIVQFGSIYGFTAPRFDIYDGTEMTMPVEYAVIKAGIRHLTRYVARYYAGSGVRINTISPGGILADQPKRFVNAYNRYATSTGMLQPEDIVGTVRFLLSDGARHINGQDLVVDDGWSL